MTKKFKGFSFEEIKKAERNSFVIVIGADFYQKDGSYAFSLSQAEKHYETLLENIAYTIEDGTEKQKDAALNCLETLNILPLRIH